jgi:hypothetical protein
MGRYAQARRRGRGAPVTGALGPPPAPVLDIHGGWLTQYKQGLDDPGGFIELWFSVDQVGPFVRAEHTDWASPHQWGEPMSLDPGWYAAKEVGNGVVYVGTSALSPAIFVTL